jgi:hypothetical protein
MNINIGKIPDKNENYNNKNTTITTIFPLFF